MSFGKYSAITATTKTWNMSTAPKLPGTPPWTLPTPAAQPQATPDLVAVTADEIWLP